MVLVIVPNNRGQQARCLTRWTHVAPLGRSTKPAFLMFNVAQWVFSAFN